MTLDVVPWTETSDRTECIARSECTYVPADLALHSPLNRFMTKNDKTRMRGLKMLQNILFFLFFSIFTEIFLKIVEVWYCLVKGLRLLDRHNISAGKVWYSVILKVALQILEGKFYHN